MCVKIRNPNKVIYLMAAQGNAKIERSRKNIMDYLKDGWTILSVNSIRKENTYGLKAFRKDCQIDCRKVRK